jgi:hypothetical protein
MSLHALQFRVSDHFLSDNAIPGSSETEITTTYAWNATRNSNRRVCNRFLFPLKNISLQQRSGAVVFSLLPIGLFPSATGGRCTAPPLASLLVFSPATAMEQVASVSHVCSIGCPSFSYTKCCRRITLTKLHNDKPVDQIYR